jgi:hypothetical protein
MAATNTAKPTPKQRRKPRYANLFFFRRRPHFRGIPYDWERPADDEQYQKMIEQDDFVSIKHWDRGELSKHPIIARDLKDLEQYLLPTYFEFSQKSKFFQNKFYLYQWVFVWGAFFTTVFGSISTLFSLNGGDTVMLGNTGISAHQIFSILTAIIGATTAFTTTLSNRGEPQKRWGKTRRLAEELRMHYFNYLSHLAPYDQPDRVQKLRENVINIRVKEQENV